MFFRNVSDHLIDLIVIRFSFLLRKLNIPTSFWMVGFSNNSLDWQGVEVHEEKELPFSYFWWVLQLPRLTNDLTSLINFHFYSTTIHKNDAWNWQKRANECLKYLSWYEGSCWRSPKPVPLKGLGCFFRNAEKLNLSQEMTLSAGTQKQQRHYYYAISLHYREDLSFT